jgi:hypothetical protein
VLVGAAGERPAGTAHPIWYDTRTVFTLRFVVAAAQPDGQATNFWVWFGSVRVCRYLPSFVLEWIRPALGKGFVDKAWHPSTDRCVECCVHVAFRTHTHTHTHTH